MQKKTISFKYENLIFKIILWIHVTSCSNIKKLMRRVPLFIFFRVTLCSIGWPQTQQFSCLRLWKPKMTGIKHHMWLRIVLFTKGFNFLKTGNPLEVFLMTYSKETKIGRKYWELHLSLFSSTHKLGWEEMWHYNYYSLSST